MPATKAALTINVVPAVAMLTGWLALAETMAPLQIAACVLIVGSVVFAEIAGRRTPSREITDSRVSLSGQRRIGERQ